MRPAAPVLSRGGLLLRGDALVAVGDVPVGVARVGVRGGLPAGVRAGLLVGHVGGVLGVRPAAENDDVRAALRVGRIVEQQNVARLEFLLGNPFTELGEAARPFVSGQLPGHRDIARAVLPVTVGPVRVHVVRHLRGDPGLGPVHDLRTGDGGRLEGVGGLALTAVGAVQRGRVALGRFGIFICENTRSVGCLRGGGGRYGMARSEGGGGHGGQGESPVRGRMGGGAPGRGTRQDAAPVDAAGAVAVAPGVEFLEYRRLHAIPLTVPSEKWRRLCGSGRAPSVSQLSSALAC